MKAVTEHSPPDLDAILADPNGPCPCCVRLLVKRLADERDAARAELAGAYRGAALVRDDRDAQKAEGDAAFETLREVVPGTPLTLREAARCAAKALRAQVGEQPHEQDGDADA